MIAYLTLWDRQLSVKRTDMLHDTDRQHTQTTLQRCLCGVYVTTSMLHLCVGASNRKPNVCKQCLVHQNTAGAGFSHTCICDYCRYHHMSSASFSSKFSSNSINSKPCPLSRSPSCSSKNHPCSLPPVSPVQLYSEVLLHFVGVWCCVTHEAHNWNAASRCD